MLNGEIPNLEALYKEYYNDTLKWYSDKLITNYT